VSAQLAASQEGLISMKSVSYLVSNLQGIHTVVVLKERKYPKDSEGILLNFMSCC
jgi:hypothetical protein